MKQIRLLLLVLMSWPILVNADKVDIDGIWFDLIPETNSAWVIFNPNKDYNSGTTYYDEVVIPEKVTYDKVEYTVDGILDYAFLSSRGLTSVTIPNSVKTISKCAFFGCSGLTTLIIPNSVTYIGYNAFEGCSGLTSLLIPDGVKTIEAEAFKGCGNLTSLAIGKSVNYIGIRAFDGCSALKSIIVDSENAHFDSRNNCNAIIFKNNPSDYLQKGCVNTIIPNNVTCIGDYAFRGCIGLTSLTIPASVTRISSEAFAKCEDLTDVFCLAETPPTTPSTAFADSHQENITLHVPYGCSDAYQANEPWKSFKKCEEIEENQSGSAELNVGDSFESTVDGAWCKFLLTDGENVTLQSSLQDGQVVIPSTVTYNGVEYTITAIEGTETGISDKPNSTVFINKNSITGVVIPNTVTKIGACAFYGCSKITSLTIGSSVQNIGDYAFYDCLSLTSITWGTSLKTIGKMAFNCDYDSKLTAVTIPNGIEEIGDNAFCMNSLTTVTLPTSIKKLSNGAFNNWQTSEMKVNISDLTAFSSIEMISDEYGYGFGFGKYRLYLNSTEVTDLTIPSGITKVGQIYAGCNSIQSLTFYKDVTEIAGLAFVECSNITKVTTLNKTPVNISSTIRFEDTVLKNATLQVPSGTTAAYKNAGWNFSNVEELEGLQDGDVFTASANGGTLRFKVLSAADKTCQVGADNRSDGLVPGGGKWNRVIPSKVTGSDGQEYTVIGIGDRAFFEYDGIESFTLPATLKQISEGAFMRCHDLKYITIPAGVTTMGKYIFNGQEVLTEVVSLIENPYSIDESMFAGRYGNKATLVVPAGKKSAYENTDGWKLFTRIVEMNSGDADGNEDVDEQDVNLVREYILTGKEPKGFVRQNADTQSNNSISVVDIVNILNIIKSKK